MVDLAVITTIRQAGGSVRHLLDVPGEARRMRAIIRGDSAMVDGLRPAVIVDEDARGLTAWEWPGRKDGEPPPWDAIRAAL